MNLFMILSYNVKQITAIELGVKNNLTGFVFAVLFSIESARFFDL